jgi:cysteine desulfurase / selenocysteine lyase
VTLNDARCEFPALDHQAFLDSACVSLAPQRAITKLRAFLDMAAACPSGSSTQHHLDMDTLRSAARPQLAKLINASENDIALVESTSHGLNLVATAIPLKRGDRVLISDLEFIEVAVPWLQKPGIAIDMVPNRNGQILMEDVEAAITPSTRVLALSSVQWSNGFRCDLDSLSRLCRSRNIFLILDAVQHIGTIPLDVEKTPVDAIACGGHKWLMSPFGCGFLYLNPQFRAQLNPPLAGYLSVTEPEGGWDTYFQTPSITPVRHYHFVDSAARWETGGTANYPGAIGLAESVALINDIGIDNVAGHNLCLTDYLIDSLHQQNIEIVTPLDRRYRSAIVTFTVGSADDNIGLTSFLQQHKILVGVRYTSSVGGVRVSCHLFNNREDLDRLVSLTAEFLKPRAKVTA